MGRTKLTLRERIVTIMKAEGWSQSVLAKKAGTARQTVNNWINNPEYERIDADYAFNIAEESKSHFNPRWIFSGDGPERLPPRPNAEEQSWLERMKELKGRKREALLTLLLES